MGSRLRNDVKHLIECFCEVACPNNANEVPWVVQKYPDPYPDEGMLKQIPLFAFPTRVTSSTAVQHFSFVFTSLDSKWTFGFCRQAAGAQTSLVVISYLPWHELFFKILNQIAELIQEQALSDVNSFLESVHQREVPGPGTTLHIPYGKAHRVYTCKCPNTYTLPSIPENRNLTEYFNAVDTHNMMVIFASMLHERRIIMVSSRVSRLSACIQAANAVIYPMIWQHIYIPVLPPHLIDYLLAPMPYLAGVPTSTWQRVRRSELGEVVILDVDSNQIESPFNDLDSLPQDIVSGMRRRLKTPGHMMGDGVARVFLRALVQLIGGYRVALRMCPGEQITFCRDALLNSRPPALRPFLESMLQLQIFQQFIEERLEMLNCGQGFSDEFELEACLYSDKSSKQYKEWLSTMKKESGALFKTVRNKANPAMRNAVKSVGKMAKRKSRTAMKEVRMKFKELNVSDIGDDTSAAAAGHRHFGNGKPRSAPSSPNFLKMKAASLRGRGGTAGTAAAAAAAEVSGSEQSHSLRRCETSVNPQQFIAGSSSPGYSAFRDDSNSSSSACAAATTTTASSSSAESSNDDDEDEEEEEEDDDELNMAPLNLNLMDDMKDILSRATSSYSNPPSVPDRSRKPNIFYPPPPPTIAIVGSRAAHPAARTYPSPRVPTTTTTTTTSTTTTTPLRATEQALPLPPPRCRKRGDVPTVSHLIAKYEGVGDLIRLDTSTSRESTIDEFDPLNSDAKCHAMPNQLSNPGYSYHHLPNRQKAEPQVAPSRSPPPPPPPPAAAAAAAGPSFKGYTGRFNAGSDPFSDLLAFTRTNYGPCTTDEEANQPKDPSPPTHTWTKFD